MISMRFAPSAVKSVRFFRRTYAVIRNNKIIPRKPGRRPLTADDVTDMYLGGVPRNLGRLSRASRTSGFKWVPTTALLTKCRVTFAKNTQTMGRVLVLIQRNPSQMRKYPMKALEQVTAMVLRVEEGSLLIKALQFCCLELLAMQRLIDAIWESPYIYDRTSLSILILKEFNFAERSTWASSKSDVHLIHDTTWHLRRNRLRQRLSTVRYYSKPLPGESDPSTNNRLVALDHVSYYISTANCLFFDICVDHDAQRLQVLEADFIRIKDSIAKRMGLTESSTESLTESLIESSTETSIESSTENSIESSTENSIESSTESSIERPIESSTEDLTLNHLH